MTLTKLVAGLVTIVVLLALGVWPLLKPGPQPWDVRGHHLILEPGQVCIVHVVAADGASASITSPCRYDETRPLIAVGLVTLSDPACGQLSFQVPDGAPPSAMPVVTGSGYVFGLCRGCGQQPANQPSGICGRRDLSLVGAPARWVVHRR